MDNETVNQKVLALKASGKSAGEIAEIMNAKGIKTKTGLKFTAQKVFNTVYQSKQRSGHVKKARQLLGHVEEVVQEESTNADIVNLLNSTKYTDRQKVEAVKALLR